jgi:tetrahydromethanopterin S-methyltransferase subunit B
MEAKAGPSPSAVTTDDNDFTQRIRHLEELVDSMRSSILSPYSTPLEKVS